MQLAAYRIAHEMRHLVLLDIHRQAVADTMAYTETQIGFARRGKNGVGGLEPGELGWISFQHHTGVSHGRN
jgi:hypothetical protein